MEGDASESDGFAAIRHIFLSAFDNELVDVGTELRFSCPVSAKLEQLTSPFSSTPQADANTVPAPHVIPVRNSTYSHLLNS